MPRRAVAALAGAMAVPVGLSAVAPARAETPVVAARAAEAVEREGLDEGCFARTICSLKDRVRWRTPAWSGDFCRKIGRGVLTSARRHDVPPTLLLAVMINESDMNEKSFGVSVKNGKVHAKDSGLMGVRCVLDGQGRCTNGKVRGMSWQAVMEPLTNIELGARELAHWKRAGVMRSTVRVRDRSGRLEVKKKLVPCPHRTHAYWAHYNHGPVYIDRGPARHYPHRIAVLYYALARAMNVDAPELAVAARITIQDAGLRPRTPDRPVEARYRKLCDQIRESARVCSRVAAATVPAGRELN